MELNTLGEVVSSAQTAVMVGMLLWLRRGLKSPKWRMIGLVSALGLVLAWIVDHL